jgi:signal transduction histidine kinase
MKSNLPNFLNRYKKALQSHLEQGHMAKLEFAIKLGNDIHARGMPTLDLARLHERTLVMDLLPMFPTAQRAILVKQAGAFFAAVIAAPLMKDDTKLEAAHLKTVISVLSDRTMELAAANQLLGLEIVRHQQVETSLNKSERHLLESLEKSDILKQQLRSLSRQVLSAQENERKKTMKELHDVISQSLMSINVRLTMLKTEARTNSKKLERNITHTQKIVVKAAGVVNQFARDLHPTVLDDLGLIPAMHSLMKSFTSRTGVLTHLTVFAGIEKLDMARRMVFYRVAEESLANVARHARATRVDVTILKEAKSVVMEVSDNGKAFEVETVMLATGSKHLGLFGMRERVEMVRGSFQIHSTPASGTMIIARIPVSKATMKKWDLDIDDINSKYS